MRAEGRRHTNAGVVRMYTELAGQWRELAEQIDRNKDAIGCPR